MRGDILTTFGHCDIMNVSYCKGIAIMALDSMIGGIIMKKIVCSILILSLLLAASCAMGEVPTEVAVDEPVVFSRSLIEHMDGYEYDPFERSWRITATASVQSGRTQLRFILGAFGSEDHDDVISPMFFASGSSTLTSTNILIGTDVYHFSNIYSGAAGMLDRSGREFLQALCDADGISIRYTSSSGNTDVDFSAADLADVKAIARVILDTNMFDTMSAEAERSASIYMYEKY